MSIIILKIMDAITFIKGTINHYFNKNNSLNKIIGLGIFKFLMTYKRIFCHDSDLYGYFIYFLKNLNLKQNFSEI